MSNTDYQDIVSQAWTTYLKNQATYRGKEYTALLEPLYTSLFKQFGGTGDVVTALGKDNPPSETALNAAEEQFGLLQSSLDNMGIAFGKFAEMDKTAINKAASLDQPKLRPIYAGVQAADEALFATFATTVFGAQEDAARALGVYAESQTMATSTQPVQKSS